MAFPWITKENSFLVVGKCLTFMISIPIVRLPLVLKEKSSSY